MALNWWEPKANEDWSKVTRHEAKLEEWQRRTRAPGKLVLTVWIVNGLRTSQKDNQELNSVSFDSVSPSLSLLFSLSFSLLFSLTSYPPLSITHSLAHATPLITGQTRPMETAN